MSAHPLANASLESCKVGWADVAGLERDLALLVQKARAIYPGLAVDDATFVRHLGDRIGEAGPAELANVNVPDLLLARACARGEHAAILVFEDQCMRRAEGAIARKGVSRDVIEEAKQNVRERMLVGDGVPRILDYNGKGELKHWLRVAVVREAIYLSKKADRDVGITYELFTVADPTDSPEVNYFKARYRAEYKVAFEAAIAQLGSRERSLLRQQYVLGMTVDQIGTIYQVHRATAARWVQSAREDLLAKARFELGQRTGLSRSELENIVRLIESQLNVSLNRLLSAKTKG
jgi:RNA polymerase sigma-70 factor (ECF subfamily)